MDCFEKDMKFDKEETKKYVETILSNADVNKNGVIDYTEFIVAA